MDFTDVECPECGKEGRVVTNYQNGNMVCKRCATVVQDQIVSDAPEWRTFTEEESNEVQRAGAPYNPALGSLSFLGEISAAGRGPQAQAMAKSLTRTSYKEMLTSSEKRLLRGVREISRVGPTLELRPSTVARAQTLLRHAIEMPSQVFATPSCVLAALVFIASRAEGELISLERAADAFRVSAKETRKAYTRCLKTIEGLNDAMVRPSNLQYIDSLTTALQLPASFNFRLRRLVDTVSKLDIASRHTPRVFIAGCAMLLGTLTPQLAEKHQLSAASLGEAIGTTTKTITAVHQALKKSIPTILKLLSQASKAEPKAADAADSKATANGEGQQGPPTQHISSAASVASAASSSSASSEGTGRAPPTRGSGYHLPTWSSYYMVSGPSLSSLSLTKSRAPESAPPGAEAWDGSQDPLNVDRIPDTEVFATHRPSSVAEAIQRRKGHTATLTLPAKEKEIIPNFRILPSREEVEEEAKAPQPSYDEWTAPSRPSVSASERSRPHGLGYPSRAGGFLNANELPFSMKAEEKAEEYRPAAVKPELPGPQSYIPHLPRPAASLPSSSGPPSFASGLPSASASATPSPSRPRVGRFFRSRVKPERGSASALPPLSELPPLPGLPSLSDSMQSSKRRRVA